MCFAKNPALGGTPPFGLWPGGKREVGRDFQSAQLKTSLLSEVRLDFMTEFLRDNVECWFGLKDFKGGPVIKVVWLNGSSGDESDEELM